MPTGNAVVTNKKTHLSLFSRDVIIAAFQQDIINNIRAKGSFSYKDPWYVGYIAELRERGLNLAEIRSMEDIAVAAAKS